MSAARARWSLWLVLLAGCNAGARPPATATSAPLAPLSSLADARWTWLSAECVDGGLALDSLGFDRTLRSELRGDRVVLTYDTELAEPLCASTEVWTLSPLASGQFWFKPEARVTLPAGAACGAREETPRQGVLRLTGDTLEEIHFGSEWCRGFDVRFTYRRTTPLQLSPEQVVRRYVAHWNRRDPRAVASLFAEDGQLLEPFTRSPDGSLVRHAGRPNVEAWLADAFATTPWLAMQLTEIEPRSEGQVIASWRYMDARLAEPLTGRNLYVLAGGEIFATEVQLLAPPSPRTEP
ncbi:MAG TPA: nuclear transport factor 2 family protein [Polyangiales bacterium]|nr:nuclear transport factor 2 family protein [Polyangiales bacterium]